MARVLPFLIWPDPRLRQPAAPVGAVTDDIRAIWDQMLAAMYAMPGVGLAAPQIGVMLQLAVVDAQDNGVRAPLRMANPQIIAAATTLRDYEEGSPNLPGLWAKVQRPDRVTLRYLDETGAQVDRALSGLWAISAQHQVDHLQGRMFFDRLGPVKRRMLLDKHAKRVKRGL